MSINRGSGYYITDKGLDLMESLEKKVTNDFRRRALKTHRLYVVLMSIRDEDPLDDFELIRLDWLPQTLQRILQEAETKGYIARETEGPVVYEDWSFEASGHISKRPVGTVGYDAEVQA